MFFLYKPFVLGLRENNHDNSSKHSSNHTQHHHNHLNNNQNDGKSHGKEQGTMTGGYIRIVGDWLLTDNLRSWVTKNAQEWIITWKIMLKLDFVYTVWDRGLGKPISKLGPYDSYMTLTTLPASFYKGWGCQPPHITHPGEVSAVCVRKHGLRFHVALQCPATDVQNYENRLGMYLLGQVVVLQSC